MTDPAALLRAFAAESTYRGLSPATTTRRLCTLRQLVAHAAPRHLFELDTRDLKLFLTRWPCASTRRNYRDDLAAFYRWALVEGYHDADPAERLGTVKVATPGARPLPDALIRALLATPDPDTRRMVYLAAYGGLRVAEIAQVRGEDIDRDGDMFQVRNGKGGKSRRIPLLPELGAELADVAAVGRLFPGATGGMVSGRLKRLLRRHGYPHARPHDLRHTFASRVARRLGGDLVAVAQLLGHASMATTRRYVDSWMAEAGKLTGLYERHADAA